MERIFNNTKTAQSSATKQLSADHFSSSLKIDQSKPNPADILSDIDLSELIDAKAVQSLMDDFYKLAKIPMAIVDLKGDMLVGVGWQEICTNFHRINPRTCAHCVESDTKLTIGVPRGEFRLYKCKNNMWDIATPIFVAGKHIANLFVGQFFFEEEQIDHDFFTAQAQNYGFNEAEYINALKKVPRLSRESVNTAMKFFVRLADMISQLSFSNIKLSQFLNSEQALSNSLNNSRQLLAVTLASIGDAVIVTDPSGKITFLNGEAERLTGWKNEEACGKHLDTVFKIINEYTREPVESPVTKVLLKGTAVGLANHTLLITKNGTEIPIDDSGAPIKQLDGSIHGVVLVFRDFSEKKNVEQTLRQNREDLNRAQSVAQVGSWRLNVQENQLTWSDENHRIFGISKDEPMSYETFLSLIHPEDKKYVDMKWNAALRGEEYDIEHRIIVDGRVKWVRERAELEFDSNQTLLGGFGTTQDITARKKNESNQSLATSVLQVLNHGTGDTQSLVKEVLDLIKNSTAFDSVGLRIRIGEDFPYFEHSGFSEEFIRHENSLCTQKDGNLLRDANGKPVLECACGSVLSGKTDPGMSCFTQGGSFWTNKSTELLDLDAADDPRANPRNHCIHVGYNSVALIPVRANTHIIGLLQLNDHREGQFTLELIKFFETLADNIGLALARKDAELALMHARDELEMRVEQRTTELRKTADALEYERKRFEDVLDMLPAYVILLTKDYHIPFANRFFEERFGKSNGKRCYEYLFNRTEPCEVCETYKVLETNKPHHWEWTGPDGRNYDISDFPFTDSDGSPLIMEVGLDITEQKQAKAELDFKNTQLHERAQQLAKLASELTLTEQRERHRLAQILHDHLQQLLVGAKFGLEMLGRRTKGSDLKDSINDIYELVKESIAASRSLTVELSPPILHEAGLIAGLEWLVRWMNEKHGLNVELHTNDDAFTDREEVRILLFQSVRELLLNVVKYAGVTTAKVDLARVEGSLQLVVSDKGLGFDSQASTTNVSAGGFGLFSIRERIALLGGTMHIESAHQMGTKITLLAPADYKNSCENTSKDEKMTNKETEQIINEKSDYDNIIRVLMVDDHAVMRQGLCSLLRRESDIEIVGEASNGKEAVEMAARIQPDIILMDFSMPLMNGIEATKIINSESPNIKIIGLSMYEEADRAKAMLDAGASSYVTKSGEFTTLLETIRYVYRS